MKKEEVQKRVLQYGKPLDFNNFSWDEKTRTFSSNEKYLVFDFSGVDNITFKTGSLCTFDTGLDCTFDTGPNCTFNTGSICTFNTGSRCTFKTGWNCTFKTGWGCTFDIRVMGYFINKTSNNIVVIRNYDKYKIYELNSLPKGFLQLEIDKVIEKEKENE